MRACTPIKERTHKKWYNDNKTGLQPVSRTFGTTPGFRIAEAIQRTRRAQVFLNRL